MRRAPAQPNQSLIDGLTVLQAVAARREPVRGSDLARELGLEPTRVNRLLKTLAWLELVYQADDRRYAAGPGMHVLAAQSLFGSGLIQRAIGPLEGLGRLGLVVALGVLWRDQVAYLYHWQPGRSSGAALGRTALYPATRSGIGLALLAARPEDEVLSLYRADTIPGFASPAELAAELAATRRRGYAQALTGDGLTVGCSFGQPVYAAVALAGPAELVAVADRVVALRVAIEQIERPGDAP